MKRRRAVMVFIVCGVALWAVTYFSVALTTQQITSYQESAHTENSAYETLRQLPVREWASTEGYSRDQFGDGWDTVLGCSVRVIILYRDLRDTILGDNCTVISGVLDDPYSGEEKRYSSENPSDIQIDHVVALSNAWKTGAAMLTQEQREKLANDPLNLLAVDGKLNQIKGDADAADWMPPEKEFHCTYIARQIAVKYKYSLWVRNNERQAMEKTLSHCEGQKLPPLDLQ